MKIGFFGILGLIFITLKLMAIIDWSWWLVLLPIYGGVAIWLVVVIATIVVLAISSKR